MSGEPANLILEQLRLMRDHMNRMDVKLDRIMDDVRDLKIRMTSVEESLAGVNRRLDRMELRLDRVESRLDFVGHHG